MGDKETKLSIVIRTVDKATAKIKAINDRLDAATKPLRNFKEALSDLKSKSGLDDVIGGFRGVGSAIAGALAKVAVIGGVVGGAVAAVLSLVGSFDDLGDKAESIGVGVDFLAQMRYAAERSGVAVENLDSGLQGFSTSLGMLRAGKGKMLAFLNVVSPALAKQLKGAKNNEEAFNLLATAASKIVDPAKRAAFAQKTLGDASLAPLLGKGAKGIKELRDRYAQFAGSQEEAAKKAGEVDDALKDLHASTDGVKAALVTGLAPALRVIVDRLRDWFVGHRAEIAEWATSIGERLPGAIQSMVTWLGKAYDTVTSFIDRIGGLKTVGIALVAFIVGPLVAAIGSFGLALMTTPAGPFLVAIGLIVAGIADLVDKLDKARTAMEKFKAVAGFLVGGGGGIGSLGESKLGAGLAALKSEGLTKNSAETGDLSVRARLALGSGARSGAGQGAAAEAASAAVAAMAALGPSKAKIDINISGAPRGTRVTADPQNTANVNTSVGILLGAP